jgi:hypothetical protein
MPLAIPKPSSGTYEKCPEGNHVAVCCGIIDLGTHFSEKYGNSQRKVMIEWEISGETKSDGSPYYIDRTYTFSTNELATLRTDLESWRGRKFTDKELTGSVGTERFELSNILGVGCMLNVIHQQKNDKSYANVASIAQMPKLGMPTPPLVARRRCLSLSPGEFDADEMEGLSDYVLSQIKESPEYKSLMTGHAGTNTTASHRAAAELVEADIPF